MAWLIDPDAVAAACSDIPSPGLLVFPDLVEQNIAHMVDEASGPERLCPHLKTTKCAEVVEALLAAGVSQFKCATLSEMRLALQTGAKDIILSLQPVGPAIEGLARLAADFPDARLATIVDSPDIVPILNDRLPGVDLFIDIDVGMGRTGMVPGDRALSLRAQIKRFAGWHVYDGHLRQADAGERRQATEEAWRPFWEMDSASDTVVIAGGTPTFPFHAKDPRVQCSPGTCVFWDAGYAKMMSDETAFQWAACVITRIISQDGNRLTLDLGHKAVASESPLAQRVVFPSLPDATFTGHSEEHLVLTSPSATRFRIGDALLGIPWHICPTVALHDRATTIVDGQPTGHWPIAARGRFGCS